MKKSLLFIAAFIGFGFVNAQTAQFGFKAGLNISNQSYKVGGNTLDGESVYGVQAGIFVEIKASEKLTVQPELLFSTQGSKLSTPQGKASFDLNYVIVPVMVKFYPASKLFLEAGPQIGFLTSAKAGLGSMSGDAKEVFETTDFALNLGLGYNITNEFSAGVRYNLGLSNVAKNNDSGLDMKNSGFLIGIAYKI